MATERIRLLKNVIIQGLGACNAGEEYVVSRFDASMLVSDGSAEYINPPQKAYTVTTIAPDHGDPIPRRIATAPAPAKVKKDE